MYNTDIEPKLSNKQKKEIRLIVERYFRIKFKKKFKLLTGIKIK